MAKTLKRENKGHLALDKVFLLYWLLITFLGCFHLYGLYEITNIVYFLVVIGCFSFFCGYHLANQNHAAQIRRGKKVLNLKNEIGYLRFKPVFYVILAIALFIIFRQVMLLLPVILARGMADARGDMQVDDSLVLSGGLDILLAYFAKPFVKASIIVLIVNS